MVFDLDGTLVDSQVDLSNSVNATLRHLGKQELPHAVIRRLYRRWSGMLVRRALGDPEGDVHDEEYVHGAIEYFLDYYREHKLDSTYVYEGVVEALDAIRAELSGGADGGADEQARAAFARDLRALGMDRFFFQNYGGNSFHTKKPDPVGLLALMAEAGVGARRP